MISWEDQNINNNTNIISRDRQTFRIEAAAATQVFYFSVLNIICIMCISCSQYLIILLLFPLNFLSNIFYIFIVHITFFVGMKSMTYNLVPYLKNFSHSSLSSIHWILIYLIAFCSFWYYLTCLSSSHSYFLSQFLTTYPTWMAEWFDCLVT